MIAMMKWSALVPLVTQAAEEEDETENAGKKVAVYRISRWKCGPVRMDEMLHIVFHKVDHFSSRRIPPLDLGGPVIIERTFIEHFDVNDMQPTGRDRSGPQPTRRTDGILDRTFLQTRTLFYTFMPPPCKGFQLFTVIQLAPISFFAWGVKITPE